MILKAGRIYREAERPMPMEIPMADCTENPRQKMTYEVPIESLISSRMYVYVYG